MCASLGKEIVNRTEIVGPVAKLHNSVDLRDPAVRMNYCIPGTGRPHFPLSTPFLSQASGASPIYANKDICPVKKSRDLLREAAKSLLTQRSGRLDPEHCHLTLQRPPALGWPAQGQPTPHSTAYAHSC